MAKTSRIRVKKGPEFTAEEIQIGLDLNLADRKRFKANPSQFLRKVLEDHGIPVNRIIIGYPPG